MDVNNETTQARNRDLRKFYQRSCVPEVSEPINGVVDGELPHWLRGTLLRNGPGLSAIGFDRYNHVFDGLGLVRQFSIENGQVFYRNRFLRSQSYIRNHRANRIVVSEFGTLGHPDPCASLFDRLTSYFTVDISDNALVNVMPIGDEVYAMTESPYMFRVDPVTLETVEKKKLTDLVAVHTATAHPHLDPDDGSTYNIGTKMGLHPGFVLIHYPSSGVNGVRAVGKIPFSSRTSVPYVHSFALTENWVVVLEQPLALHLPTMLRCKLLGDKAYLDALKFDPTKGVRFHVMNKKTGELHPAVFEAATFFIFHHINAFEQGEDIIVDACCFDNDNIVRSLVFTETNPGKFEMAHLRRFTLPLNRGGSEGTTVMPQNLAKGDLYGELPRVNQNYNGKPYRFAYCTSHVPGQEHRMFLSKIDVTTGEWQRWEGQGWYPSEPVFVPRPGGVEEDDGVVLSSLLQEDNEKRLALVVLEARSFQQLAMVEFDCPSSVPGDFHGWFFQDQEKKE
ncbi:carotenoid isomerooxygenase [Rhipicephalus sanguineus]|uniref:carotenoid isomerooxygenase n=1 Tax=Rhipicephalus sanguineus TaxID=34632 RepID=UPI0018952A44|nr:carotenoid isomerooxygenase [Rhipicephalus sanguineus]